MLYDALLKFVVRGLLELSTMDEDDMGSSLPLHVWTGYAVIFGGPDVAVMVLLVAAWSGTLLPCFTIFEGIRC